MKELLLELAEAFEDEHGRKPSQDELTDLYADHMSEQYETLK